ncbi:MAG: cupredoxin domain-containing protein [Thaumarchaeota archaeon]|nr:cupredoxin domain-containing protein [Nitrososphaerota archaeon]
METEEPTKPGNGFLWALGIVAILLGALVAAELAIPLQPGLGAGGACPSVSSCVAMPPNAASAGFSSDNITVIVGVNNTVIWTNQDTVAHTVVSTQVPQGASTFASVVLAKGDTFSQSFTTPGVYSYECSIHPLTMKGTVVVKPA